MSGVQKALARGNMGVPMVDTPVLKRGRLGRCSLSVGLPRIEQDPVPVCMVRHDRSSTKRKCLMHNGLSHGPRRIGGVLCAFENKG
jgi:hypothetical protein